MSESQVARRTAPASTFAVLALIAGLLLGLAGAGSASAAQTKITKVFGGPVAAEADCKPTGTATKTDAAEFTDFCVSFATNSTETTPADVDLKSQVIDTPRGFAGIADAYAQCTDAQFNKASEAAAGCLPNTQMGQVSATIRAQTSLAFGVPLGEIDENGLATLHPTGAVYNLEHGPNEVARLGIDLDPKALSGTVDQPNVKLIVRVTLRPSPDVGLRSIVDDMPKKAHVKLTVPPPFNLIIPSVDEQDELAVDEFNLLFWGPKTGSRAAMPRPFGFLGADCSNTQATTIRATGYDGLTTGGDSPTYKLTDCDDPNIPFLPSVSFSTDENRPDVTTKTTVSVKFGNSPNPAYQAAGPRKTVVTLPDGLSFSGQIASGANGLPLCKPEQFAQFDAAASSCPDATAVGTVSFKSPTQSRLLTGKVFLGAQPKQYALPDIYIEAQLGPAADAPRVKLRGALTIDDKNRIVTTLEDLPEVPVNEFLLTFRGGDQSAVVTPPTCGEFTGGLDAFSFAKPAAANTSAATYTVNNDCDAVKNFAPSVVFDLANKQAGGTGAFTTSITRPDRSERLARTQIELPAGMLANLKGVPECPQNVAAAGGCSEASRIGSAAALAGVGPAP